MYAKRRDSDDYDGSYYVNWSKSSIVLIQLRSLFAAKPPFPIFLACRCRDVFPPEIGDSKLNRIDSGLHAHVLSYPNVVFDKTEKW